MSPSSRFALSLKPSVAYRVLNFSALWKKQMTLPSLAYAGIPYQVLVERAGALALTMAWSRSARARSASCISAILASTSLSPSSVLARAPRRAAAFCSWARWRIAARSSSVKPPDALPVAPWADFWVSFIAGSPLRDRIGTSLILASAAAAPAGVRSSGVPSGQQGLNEADQPGDRKRQATDVRQPESEANGPRVLLVGCDQTDQASQRQVPESEREQEREAESRAALNEMRPAATLP